jgi:hypothetical protein
MTRRQSAECASDLSLERWLVGELADEEIAALCSHLAGCEPCRARHELLEREHRALSEQLPALPSTSSSGVVAVDARRYLLARVALGLGSLAAALALWLSLDQRKPVPITRTKGGNDTVQLDWVIRRGGEVFTPDAGEPLRPGDALRFGLRTTRRGFASVLSLDGEGRASVYHEWVAIEPGARRLLPGAIELDEVVGEEHLYGIVCQHTEPLAVLQDAIRRAPSEPELPAGCASDHHVVRKGRP